MYDRDDELEGKKAPLKIPIHVGSDVKEPEWINIGTTDTDESLGAGSGADYTSLDPIACQKVVWKVLNQGYSLTHISEQI